MQFPEDRQTRPTRCPVLRIHPTPDRASFFEMDYREEAFARFCPAVGP